ncbi:MAG TPA: sulfite exporter TauE/SafE family protein [Vicinamibacterales bacterium]|nr:sulfite exporter TauE/SafE family protein [Vicinamibacterales bacterium]
MTEAAFIFAAIIGILLGALGGGGSIVTVPVFVYALGVPAKEAIAMSLPVVGLTSLAGAASHWRCGHVHMRSALVFGAMAMLGAYAGARAGALLPAAIQLTILGLVMVAAAVSMLRAKVPWRACAPHDDSRAWPRWSWLSAVVAIAIGALTGLVGIGGGFLFVPALVLLADVPIHYAVGTSLVVITMNAAAGVTGYSGVVAIRWSFVLAFAATASVGALGGAWLAQRTTPRALRQAFGVVLLVIAALLLYENIPWRRPAAVTFEHRAGDSAHDRG